MLQNIWKTPDDNAILKKILYWNCNTERPHETTREKRERHKEREKKLTEANRATLHVIVKEKYTQNTENT